MKRHLIVRLALLAMVCVLPVRAGAQTETVIYFHTDAIGSVRAITDQNQQVVSRHDFTPFGQEWPNPTPNSPRLFAGKEFNAETEFDYFGARYYASSTGRFTSVDPALDQNKALVEPQLWNRYAYVTNNPLRFTDPDGRERAGILLDHDIRALLAGQITREQYRENVTARGVGAAIGSGLVGLSWLGQAGIYVLATRLFNTPTGQDAVQTSLEIFSGSSAPNSTATRALTAADLGVRGTLQELTGTLSVTGQNATVTIGMIRGNIENPLQIVGNLIRTAQKAGATRLRIQGTVANAELYDALKRRYGLRTQGGVDYFDVPVP